VFFFVFIFYNFFSYTSTIGVRVLTSMVEAMGIAPMSKVTKA